MIGEILVLSGAATAGIGGWRGYGAARQAIGPFVHEGDPTRSAIEASRPLVARPRVRRFVRGLVIAVGWLLVAMYGLYLVGFAQGVTS